MNDQGAQNDGVEPEILLVDTNCFLRIYHSPLRPFLGTVVQGFKILTLSTLIDEFRNSDRLMREYAWLDKDLAREEAAGAALAPLNAQDKAEFDQLMLGLRPYAESVLQSYCREKDIGVRSLSWRDLTLLAVAAVLRATVASDEWPLTLVADRLSEPDEEADDDEYEVPVITSIDLLHMLETDGKLNAKDRRDTVTSWLRSGEMLPRRWADRYQELFNERAPQLQ